MYTLKALPEFEAWLADLPDRYVRDAVVKRLTRVELGLLGDARSVGDGVSELKIDLGAGFYRLARLLHATWQADHFLADRRFKAHTGSGHCPYQGASRND